MHALEVLTSCEEEFRESSPHFVNLSLFTCSGVCLREHLGDSRTELKLRGLTILLIFFAVLCLTGKQAMAIEEAKYSVLIKDGDFELRRYAPHIVAETIVEGDFSTVGNEGFRRLFKFISGENHKKQSIPMTAPVGQESDSTKINMTAPVSQQEEAGRWRISFLMPAVYTLETLPEPMDQRVHLSEVVGRLVAAVTYSGTWSKKRFEEKKGLLESFIKKHDLRATGEVIFARHNPPFTLWFLRRNEVLMPVEGNGS